MNVGICGTGRMGGAIASRLLEVGHHVTVWNRDATKTAPLVAAGATRADTPAALAAACDLAITMVLNADAIAAVYEGPQGLLAADLAGKLVMDMSTIMPDLTAGLAAKVDARHGAFIACPVGGTVGPARSGKLFGLVGGTDEAVAKARPVIEQLCRRVEHVGPAEAASKMKLAVNLPLLVYWEALGEALALVQSLGLSPERLIDIMADTSGTPTGMKGRMGDIVAGLSGTLPASPNFSTVGARKDLATMVDFGRQIGLTLPATAGALAGYDATIAAGHGEDDAVAVTVYGAKRARV